MKTIFIVTSGEYSDYHIEAAFNERKDAEEFAQGCTGSVEEFPLNPGPPEVLVKWVASGIDEPTGGAIRVQSWRLDTNVSRYTYSCGKPQIFAYSDVSPEDARNLFYKMRDELEASYRSRYWAKINVRTGDIEELPSEQVSDLLPPLNVQRPIVPRRIECYSDKSQEHANKLAVEARQKWLRENR